MDEPDYKEMHVYQNLVALLSSAAGCQTEVSVFNQDLRS